jgi:hypothetical protein
MVLQRRFFICTRCPEAALTACPRQCKSGGVRRIVTSTRFSSACIENVAAFNAWKEKFKDNILDMGGKLMGSTIEVREVAGP